MAGSHIATDTINFTGQGARGPDVDADGLHDLSARVTGTAILRAEAVGLGLRELSKAADISRKRLKALRAGQRAMGVDELDGLARAVGLDPGELASLATRSLMAVIKAD